ncbi:restriction endonuclease subunit S [Variovorax sp. PBL-E5]|uniref:restriction endonuclease subunit S n=1 Tax=Variovorax sp. PBL-E5 TaxID=434014 RepID=UPI00131789F4|nr:restriction endonuclease subunit S [Variovorax sp. PBL-E5]VTU40282.1 EcoKI restriction-modification system protein HsdS [Variovorax sp. PBL-E5]
MKDRRSNSKGRDTLPTTKGQAALPVGWQCKPLGECAGFMSGSTPSLNNAAFWSGEFPWVTARDMKALRIDSTARRISELGKAVAAVAPAQSVLVLTRGMTLFKDLPVCIAEREMAFNQDVKALIPASDLDASFLAYQLLANKREILQMVDTAGHGTGRLDTQLLKDLPFAFPPLPEQRRIARILATWDRALVNTERLIDKLHAEKNALMADLLTGTRRVSVRHKEPMDAA